MLRVKLTPVNPAISDTANQTPNATRTHDRDGLYLRSTTISATQSANVISMMDRAYIAFGTTNGKQDFCPDDQRNEQNEEDANPHCPQ